MSVLPLPNTTTTKVVANVPVVKVDDDLRIMKGPLLRPEIRDRQGTIIAPDVIRNAAHDFVMRLNAAENGTGPGFMHRDFKRKLHIVESWVTDQDTWYPRDMGVSDGTLAAAKLTEALVAAEHPALKLGAATEFAAPFCADAAGNYDPEGQIVAERSLLRVRVKGDTDRVDATLLRVAIARYASCDFRQFGLYAASVRSQARELLKTVVQQYDAQNDGVFSEEVKAFLEAVETQERSIFIPSSSWMLGMKVLDDDIWAGVKSGLYKGFSIGGRARIVRGVE